MSNTCNFGLSNCTTIDNRGRESSRRGRAHTTVCARTSYRRGGGRGRCRGKKKIEEQWIPSTKLGRIVNQGKIKTLALFTFY